MSSRQAKANLLSEGVDGNNIFITGNTAIDALFWVLQHTDNSTDGEFPPALRENPSRKVILVTTHRRESFGAPMLQIMKALREIAITHPNLFILFPVHKNPNVQKLAKEMLFDLKNVLLTDPIGYVTFVQAMKRSHIILTDSGGIQEEAPSLDKPVLVLRDTTERPEGVEKGTALLVGTDTSRIIKEVNSLLSDGTHFLKMSGAVNPYGDGKASDRISNILEGNRQ